MKSLTFNNIRKPWIMMLRGRTKPPFASIKRNLITIPGRNGAFLHTSTKEPMLINQPVAFIVDDDVNALQLKDELAEWLVTEKEVPLTFDDEPGRIYYAVVTNTIDDFERIATLRQGTIQFLCPDPYGYSEELTHDVTANKVIFNNGTAESFPRFDINVLQPITKLEIRNKSLEDRQGRNPAIMLGKPATVEQTPYIREELVFQDSMQSTQTWQTASEVDNGLIDGEIAVDSKGFYPSLFGPGTVPDVWQGPSLIKGIGTSLQDFKADILIENMNTTGTTGMLAVYLRDANGNKIANIGFGDCYVGYPENYAHAQVGPYATGQKVEAWADDHLGWNDFSGIMRIMREDNYWVIYFAKIEADGSHNWVNSKLRIIDNTRQYMAPITQIQVAFRKWYATEKTDLHIKNIKIYKINQPVFQAASVPYIANVGDKITIDTKKSLILKNGEYATDLAYLQSQMFPLAKGSNILEVVPNSSVNVKARYRNTYL